MKRYIKCTTSDDVLKRLGIQSMDDFEEFLYDAMYDSLDDANIEPEGLIDYKESPNEKELFKSFKDKLIDNLDGLKLEASMDTSFGTLVGSTDNIASTMLTAFVRAVENGELQ